MKKELEQLKDDLSELKDKLSYTSEHIAAARPEDVVLADEFCEDYKEFLDLAKTEREAVDTVLEMGEGDKLLAEKNRFASAEKINRSLNNAYGQVLGGGK